ncbi:MAG TPA: hypothetical protein VF515_03430 [Candidatus Binatia bacterium]
MYRGETAESAVQELLGAHAVLPEQFWTQQGGPRRACGERALMWAVLADGIDCYRRNAPPTSALRQMEFEEAERWVLDTDWDWPFSFVNLCETFGLDPAGVRHALRCWRNREHHEAYRRQRYRSGALRAA